jgi:P4 family phage/plasmid primase-like protien
MSESELPDAIRQALEASADVQDDPQESPGRAVPVGGAGMSDFDRAARYGAKVPGSNEGGRNNALNALAYRLLELFRLTETELTDICLDWCRRCSPPYPDSEGRGTCVSAYRGASKKGAIGSKWSEPKTSRNTPNSPPPGVSVGGVAVSTQKNATACSTTSGSAGDWLETSLGEEIKRVKPLEGRKRDEALGALIVLLAGRLSSESAIVQERVKDQVCNALDFSRRAFDRAMTDARMAVGGGWSTDASYPRLAAEFLNSLNGRAIRRWRGEWYEWTSVQGCYEVREDEWLDNQLSEWLRAKGLNITVQMESNMKRALGPDTWISPDVRPPTWLRNSKPGIWVSFKNGLLDITQAALTLQPHTPDLFILVSLQCAFDENARCPEFLRVLGEWQPSREISKEEYEGCPEHCREIREEVADETRTIRYYSTENQHILQEFAGYLFMPGNRHQVFLLNYGQGNDGKSVYSGVLRELLGDKNVSAVGLDAFDSRKSFGLQPILGKALNITGDVSELEKIQEGLLKTIVGADAVTIDRKHKSPVTDKLDTKFVLNCNQLPPFRDRSDGIWRRLLLVEWLNQIAADKVDRNLLSRLLRHELAGIFNWALLGFHQVDSQGFTKEGPILRQAVEAAKEATQKERGFFGDRLAFDPAVAADDLPVHLVWVDDLVQEYKDYCEANNEKRSMYGSNLQRELRKWVKKTYGAQYGELARWGDKEDAEGFKGREGTGERRRFYRGLIRLRAAVQLQMST